MNRIGLVLGCTDPEKLAEFWGPALPSVLIEWGLTHARRRARPPRLPLVKGAVLQPGR